MWFKWQTQGRATYVSQNVTRHSEYKIIKEFMTPMLLDITTVTVLNTNITDRLVVAKTRARRYYAQTGK